MSSAVGERTTSQEPQLLSGLRLPEVQQQQSNPSGDSGEPRPAESRMSPPSRGQQQRQLTRKRSSIQSNLSSLNGGTGASGHGSLHSSSSTVTSDECDSERPANYSNADYEHARNTTLLFFLDRLYLASQEGKEARTLHDLSCLFGTKEFTKDMRQIVGASRNGLKKFLQSYPSLFQIEGDKVHLTQLKTDTGATQRDYNKEAVEYFKLKLLQFGTSLVPIKNLFGYRSQATQEVRHVSGKSARDFKRFLKQNEDVFEILADEHVVLKSALAELESRGQTSLVLEQSLQQPQASEAVVSDPYLNKQFAHLVEDCIKKMASEAEREAGDKQPESQQFKVTLECLHERIHRDCRNELFLKMVETLEDLKVFLRMHPKLFKRFKQSPCDQAAESSASSADFVRLLSEAERRELEMGTAPAAAHYHHSLQLRQHSTPERSASTTEVPDSKSLAGTKIPAADSPARAQDCTTQRSQPQAAPRRSVAAAVRSTLEPRSLPPLINQQTSKQSTGGGDKSLSQASQQLRANAPPFIPSKPQRQHSSLAGGLHHSPAGARPAAESLQRSSSNLSRSHVKGLPDYRRPLQTSQSSSSSPAPIDQRGAIRTFLLKGSQQGGSGNHNLSWVPCEQRKQERAASTGAPSGAAREIAKSNENELRARTVDIVREASNIITRIMTTADAVAFDCKGYNLGFDGEITLIQFSFLPAQGQADPMHLLAGHEPAPASSTEQKPDGRVKPEVCVFDLVTNPELAYCLKPLLESDRIVKIVHDVRNKSNALYVQFDIILKNVFDTQVANLVIQQQETGKPAYKSRYISMSRLCEIYGTEELVRHRNMIKFKTRHPGTGSQSTSTSSSASLRNSKDVNYWRTRPLTKPMIFEATMDVFCLVGGIYQNLKAQIKPEYEPLFEQLNLEGVLARIKPDEIRSVKKERKIDLEVINLKRKLYSDSTGPIVLSNREIRLLRHVELTDEVREKIKQSKKVAKKLERLDMKAAELKQAQLGNDPTSSLTSTEISMLKMNGNNNNNNDCESSIDCSLVNSSLQNAESKSLADKLDEFHATGIITNLIDSSMFDELKDKMIESSSLLESLEDDDDDCDAASGHLSGKSQHRHTHGDCCKCQCHSGSLEDANEQQVVNSEVRPVDEEARGRAASASVQLDCAAVTTGGVDEKRQFDGPEEVHEREANERSHDGSDKSSLACDMAVQCDLLS